MRTIKWHLEIGMQGADRSGEFEVEDDATDEDIDVIAREEVFNFVSWNWWEESPDDVSGLGASND